MTYRIDLYQIGDHVTRRAGFCPDHRPDMFGQTFEVTKVETSRRTGGLAPEHPQWLTILHPKHRELIMSGAWFEPVRGGAPSMTYRIDLYQIGDLVEFDPTCSGYARVYPGTHEIKAIEPVPDITRELADHVQWLEIDLPARGVTRFSGAFFLPLR